MTFGKRRREIHPVMPANAGIQGFIQTSL